MTKPVTVNRRGLRWALVIIAITVEIAAFVVWAPMATQARPVTDDERERA